MKAMKTSLQYSRWRSPAGFRDRLDVFVIDSTLFRESGEQLACARTEFFVRLDFFRELTRIGLSGDVEICHRGVEPRRRQHAPRIDDLLFAFGDLTRLAIGRIV